MGTNARIIVNPVGKTPIRVGGMPTQQVIVRPNTGGGGDGVTFSVEDEHILNVKGKVSVIDEHILAV